jgi:hypothetical protein
MKRLWRGVACHCTRWPHTSSDTTIAVIRLRTATAVTTLTP